MMFDRYDICEAWYLFAADYNGGGGHWLYAKLSQLVRMGFKPAPGLCWDSLTENGQTIYRNLEIQHGTDWDII